MAAPVVKPRRISFPGLGLLRFPSASRKPSLDGGSAASASLAPAVLPGAAGASAAAPSLLQPSPSLPGGGGAPQPLSMQAVVFGADAGKQPLLRCAEGDAGWQSAAAPAKRSRVCRSPCAHRRPRLPHLPCPTPCCSSEGGRHPGRAACRAHLVAHGR